MLKLKILKILKDTFKTGTSINIFLLKIMIPTLIVIKGLSYVGVIDWVAKIIEPLMQLLGLPGESAIIWVTTFFVNIYAGLTIFSNMASLQNITTGQATVLAALMLIAHSFFVEMAVVKAAGVRLRIAVPIRIASAILFAYMIFVVSDMTETLQHTAIINLPSLPVSGSITQWMIGNIESLLFICIFVYAMVAFVEFLKVSKITIVIEYILSPILRLIGISKSAAPLTTIGVVLGLTYGGGLLVADAKSGTIKEKDVFLSIILLTLVHSLIEDTILLLLIGANFSIIMFGRLAFSLIVVIILANITHRVSDAVFYKHFYKKLK